MQLRFPGPVLRPLASAAELCQEKDLGQLRSPRCSPSQQLWTSTRRQPLSSSEGSKGRTPAVLLPRCAQPRCSRNLYSCSHTRSSDLCKTDFQCAVEEESSFLVGLAETCKLTLSPIYYSRDSSHTYVCKIGQLCK